MPWHHTLILLAQLIPIPPALPAEVVLFLLLCWWQLVILELFTTWKILLSWVIAFTEELLNNQYEGLNFPTENTDWQHCSKIALATVVLLGQRRKVPSDTRIKSLETLFVFDKETEPGRGVFPTYGQFAHFVNSVTPYSKSTSLFLWVVERSLGTTQKYKHIFKARNTDNCHKVKPCIETWKSYYKLTACLEFCILKGAMSETCYDCRKPYIQKH